MCESRIKFLSNKNDQKRQLRENIKLALYLILK